MSEFASFDFHLHTCWSYDATAEPEEYFKLAVSRGVKYIAITEHHQMDSYPEVKEIAKRYPQLTVIPGAELTVWCEMGTYDMVCLGMPETPTPELQKVFDAYHQWQRDYGDAFCKVMQQNGIPYTRENRLELLQRYRPQRTIDVQGITHVQNHVQMDYLIEEKRYLRDQLELDTLLWNEKQQNYKKLPHYPEATFVLSAVKAAGALVFIAHPKNYFRINDLKHMDALRERLGFDGVECAHTSVPHELTPFYRSYCEQHGLLSTAGSDCHSVMGDAYQFSRNHCLAKTIGEDRWLEEILERLPRR